MKRNLNAKNVSILIHFMEGLNDPKFDMRHYFHECGTPACALGWATKIESLPKHRGHYMTGWASTVFGSDAYNDLFNGLRHGHLKTPMEWAQHARAVLKVNGYEVPPLPTNPQDFAAFMERVMKPVSVAA